MRIINQELTVTIRQEDARTVVAIAGTVNFNNVNRLRDSLHLLLGRGCRELVMELHHAACPDMSGIAVMVEALHMLHRSAGHLVLRGVPASVAELLKLGGVWSVFVTLVEKEQPLPFYPEAA